MTFASGFSWFRLIPAVDRDDLMHSLGLSEHLLVPGREVANTTTHLHAWLTAFLLIGFAIAARAALERAKQRNGIDKFVPAPQPSVLGVAEVAATGVLGLMSDLLSKRDARLFFPLIAGLMTYIFVNNIQAIIPGFLPATDNVNTNVGMAIVVFLTFNIVGIARDPIGYVKHLGGPAWWLSWFMFPLEVLSLVIRPVSLTIRLTANMFGDHAVFTTVSEMAPAVVPAALLVLACVVSAIQAFVFSLLTIIYINLALPHHSHDDHGHADGHPAH